MRNVLAMGCLLVALAAWFTVTSRADASRSTATLPPPGFFPAAGEIVRSSVAVRRAPRPGARRIRLLRQLRPDYRPTIVLARQAQVDAEGRLWFRIELAMRPNGRTGWVPASAVSLHRMRLHIVIHRGERDLVLLHGRHRLLRTRVAVGAPGRETPLGSFYIAAKFHPGPGEAILGAFAMETSAYSRLTEWPGGGVVGIHGTDTPSLLGKAVSHGCIRVSNSAIRRLARLAPLGTPVIVRRA